MSLQSGNNYNSLMWLWDLRYPSKTFKGTLAYPSTVSPLHSQYFMGRPRYQHSCFLMCGRWQFHVLSNKSPTAMDWSPASYSRLENASVFYSQLPKQRVGNDSKMFWRPTNMKKCGRSVNNWEETAADRIGWRTLCSQGDKKFERERM